MAIKKQINMSKLDKFISENEVYLDPAYASSSAADTGDSVEKNIFNIMDVIMGVRVIDQSVFVNIIDQLINGITTFKDIYDNLDVVVEDGVAVKDVNPEKIIAYFQQQDIVQHKARYDWLYERLDIANVDRYFKPFGIAYAGSPQIISSSFGKTIRTKHLIDASTYKGSISYSSVNRYITSTDDETFLIEPLLAISTYVNSEMSRGAYTSIYNAEQEYKNILSENRQTINDAINSLDGFSLESKFVQGDTSTYVKGGCAQGLVWNSASHGGNENTTSSLYADTAYVIDENMFIAGGDFESALRFSGTIATFLDKYNLLKPSRNAPGKKEFDYTLVNAVSANTIPIEDDEIHFMSITNPFDKLLCLHMMHWPRINGKTGDTDDCFITATMSERYSPSVSFILPKQTVLLVSFPDEAGLRPWRQVYFKFGEQDTGLSQKLFDPLFMKNSDFNFRSNALYRNVIRAAYSGVSEEETINFTNEFIVGATKPAGSYIDEWMSGNGLTGTSLPADEASYELFKNVTLMNELKTACWDKRKATETPITIPAPMPIPYAYSSMGGVEHYTDTYHCPVYINLDSSEVTNWFHKMMIYKYIYFDGIYSGVKQLAKDVLEPIKESAPNEYTPNRIMHILLTHDKFDILASSREYLDAVREIIMSTREMVAKSRFKQAAK